MCEFFLFPFETHNQTSVRHSQKFHHLIHRILLRNIPDILKDNSVLRVVRDEASHLMPASFFPSQGHVYTILDRQTAVRQQLYPYGRRPCATNYHLQVGYKRSRIYIPNAAVQLSRFPRFIVLGPLVREQILIALFLTRCIIFDLVNISTHLHREIISGRFFSQVHA